VSAASQFVVLTGLLVLTIALAIVLKRQAAGLDAVLDNGILDLEVPWTQARADELLQKLGADRIEVARVQVLLDFAFLLVYPLFLSLACALLAHGLAGPAGLIGVLVAWSVLLAAPLDAVENFAILRLLGGRTAAPWPQLATMCAAVKFALVTGAAGYLVLAGAWRVVQHLRS
jgi:hypothetical protein